jgi:PAS domain S-box-containing protein
MDAIISVDHDQRIVLFNRAAEQVFQCPASEAMGRPLDPFIPMRYRHRHRKDVEQFGNSGGTVRSMGSMSSLLALRSDGTEFPIEASISQVVVEGQKLYTVVLRDITARKRAEDEIRELNANLEQRVAQRTAELLVKNEELEIFSYSVSHDLKAPLRGLDGYSRLLLEDHHDRLDEEGRRFLRNIRGAAAQMQELIDGLLSYSKIERRSLSPDLNDPRVLITGLLAERGPDLEGVEVSVELEPGGVLADRQGLALVLRNLIDNAIKFSRQRQPPRIEIRSRVAGGRYLLSVRDNGTGFEMKYHDRIFQIFQRLHRAEEYVGTGIGLAIVHKAMARMGGRVWAEGEPGRGAVFHLDLPGGDGPTGAGPAAENA